MERRASFSADVKSLSEPAALEYVLNVRTLLTSFCMRRCSAFILSISARNDLISNWCCNLSSSMTLSFLGICFGLV